MSVNRRRFVDLSARSLLGTSTAGLIAPAAFALPAPLRAAFRAPAPAGPLRPFQGELAPIYRIIDRDRDRHLERIREYLAQPSISAQNVGMRECAEMTAGYLRELGCQEAGLIETDGHPVVWGLYDAGAARTLVNYGMYDTQPINDPGRWRDDPRAVKVVDMPGLGKAILARGAVNTKGPLRAYLNALQAIVEAEGRLPVNMIFTIEGEEELGSPHLGQALATEHQRLAAADGLYFAFPLQNRDGSVSMYLGNKGIVSMEYRCGGDAWGRGPHTRNIHGSNAAIVESPTWRLIEALSTMTRDAGARVTIDGYLEKVRSEPSADDRELIDALVETFDAAAMARDMEVGAFVNDLDGRALIERYLYTTTWNIDGMWSGYTGDGFATILPWQAQAKVDSRIVPDQESKDIVPLARAHLNARGYRDIEIAQLSAYEWSKTSFRDPVVQALYGVFVDRGVRPEVWPHLAGSAPFYLYTRQLGLPMVLGGLGHGANQHTVDEYYVVEGEGAIAGLDEIEKAYVDFVYRFAAGG